MLNHVVNKLHSVSSFGKKVISGKLDHFLLLDRDDKGNYLLDGKAIPTVEIGDLGVIAVSGDEPQTNARDTYKKIRRKLMYMRDVGGLEINAVWVSPLYFLADFRLGDDWQKFYQPLLVKTN